MSEMILTRPLLPVSSLAVVVAVYNSAEICHHSLSESLADGDRVLEIGVGTGNTLLDEDCPAAALIVGIDLCAEGLGHAPRRRNVALVEDAPSAVTRDVLEHIDDDLARLCRVRALTTQGSRLLLTVSGHKALEPGSMRSPITSTATNLTSCATASPVPDSAWTI